MSRSRSVSILMREAVFTTARISSSLSWLRVATRRSDAKGLALESEDLTDAVEPEVEQGVELGAREAVVLGGALHFHETAGFQHDEVHVYIGGHILDVFEIEARLTANDADADRAHQLAHRRCLQTAFAHEEAARVVQRNGSAGDGSGARAAVGDEHIAIDDDLSLSEQ